MEGLCFTGEAHDSQGVPWCAGVLLVRRRLNMCGETYGLMSRFMVR